MISKEVRYGGVTSVVHVMSAGERVNDDQYSVPHSLSVISGRIRVLAHNGKPSTELAKGGVVEMPALGPFAIEALEDAVVLELSKELKRVICNPRHRAGNLWWPATPLK